MQFCAPKVGCEPICKGVGTECGPGHPGHQPKSEEYRPCQADYQHDEEQLHRQESITLLVETDQTTVDRGAGCDAEEAL